jgi:ribosomal protein S18 acetylase RimI-like enzyme
VPEWHLRPALAGDREFLFELHRAALGAYVEATWGWDDDAQRRMFDDRFAPDGVDVIEVEGEAAGMVSFEERDDEIFLASIELLPRWQGHGIGTAIVSLLLDAAEATRKPLTLRVLRTNPRAAALYRRLGLDVVGETGTHVLMASAPPARPGSP